MSDVKLGVADEADYLSAGADARRGSKVNALGGLRDDCGVHAERAEWLQRMRKCGVVARRICEGEVGGTRGALLMWWTVRLS